MMLDEDRKKEMEAHSARGFPAISKEAQLQILVHQRVEIIKKLVPEFENNQAWNPRLLGYYITISKQELNDYLRQIDYLGQELQKAKAFPSSDGLKIIEEDGVYSIYWMERGQYQRLEMKGDLDAVYDFYARRLGGPWTK